MTIHSLRTLAMSYFKFASKKPSQHNDVDAVADRGPTYGFTHTLYDHGPDVCPCRVHVVMIDGMSFSSMHLYGYEQQYLCLLSDIMREGFLCEVLHFCGARTQHIRSTYAARTQHVRSTLEKHSKSALLS